MIFSSPNYQSGRVQIKGLIIKSPTFFNLLSNLQIFFGLNASQDTNFLYIKKADLTDLTPLTNNTAESLFTAIIARLINTVGTNKQIKVDAAYWGAVSEGGITTKTIEIKFYNQLSIVDYEVQYSDVVSPMDY